SSGIEFFALGHSLLEYGHRWFLRRSYDGQRQRAKSVVPGILRAMVSVQRILPHVARARFIRHERAGPRVLPVSGKNSGHSANVSRSAVSIDAISLFGGMGRDLEWHNFHAAVGNGFSERPARDRNRGSISFRSGYHGVASDVSRRDDSLGLSAGCGCAVV